MTRELILVKMRRAMQHRKFTFLCAFLARINVELKSGKLLWIINIIFNWKRCSGSQSHFYGHVLRQGRIRHE